MKNSVRKSVAAVSAVILTASVCTGMNVFNNQNNILSDRKRGVIKYKLPICYVV